MGNLNLLCVLLIIFLLEVQSAIDLCPPPSLKTCSGHGTCSSSICTCDAGWGNAICNETSDDPDCDFSAVNCPENSSKCLNKAPDPSSPPTWGCQCYQGYSDKSSGSGENCTDNDECQLSTSCPITATCTNIPGSFFCTCKQGYDGDGTSCTDTDECKKTPNPCATKEGSECQNLLPPAFYECPCKSGYFEVPGANPARCTNDTRAPVTPVTPVESGPVEGYIVIFKVIPSVVCWTRNPTSWKVYLSYNNRYYQDRYVGENNENALVFDSAPPKSTYPGRILSYEKGEHYAFVVENPRSSNTSSITWQLDGNRVTIDSTDSDFNNHRCPKDIILTFSGDVSCSVTKAQLQSKIHAGITSLLAAQVSLLSVPPEHTLTVDVTTGCTKKRAIQESATVTITVSDPATPSDTSKYSAMDIVFPTLINSSMVNEIRKAGVNITQDSPSIPPSSGINPLTGSPDPDQVKAPPEPDLPALNMSFLTFAIIFGSVVIGLILLCIIAVLIYKGRSEDEEERV